jgi:hypothetical protein
MNQNDELDRAEGLRRRRDRSQGRRVLGVPSRCRPAVQDLEPVPIETLMRLVNETT